MTASQVEQPRLFLDRLNCLEGCDLLSTRGLALRRPSTFLSSPALARSFHPFATQAAVSAHPVAMMKRSPAAGKVCGKVNRCITIHLLELATVVDHDCIYPVKQYVLCRTICCRVRQESPCPSQDTVNEPDGLRDADECLATRFIFAVRNCETHPVTTTLIMSCAPV